MALQDSESALYGANMSGPLFAPRWLNPLNDSLSESVYIDLMKSYAQIHDQ